MKHCCKEAVVAVENIERHLTTLLGDTFGMPREKTEGGGSTPTDLAAWLRTYFVAKDELETRLSELKAAMQATVIKGQCSQEKCVDEIFVDCVVHIYI